MPTCTPIYGFTYALCSDPPCDIGDTFCEFVNQVEVELDRLDDAVDRTVDTVPMAQVRLTVPRSQAAGTTTLVPFDTVDVDTDDMVDLDANPYTINLSREGVWFVYFNVEGTTAGVGNEISARSQAPAGSVAIAIQLYLDDGSPLFLSSSGEQRYMVTVPAGTTGYTTADPRLVLAVGSAAVVTPLTAVTFGAYWLRDLP